VAADELLQRTTYERFDAFAYLLCILKPFHDLLSDVGPVRMAAQRFLKTLFQGNQAVFLDAFIREVDQIGFIHGWTRRPDIHVLCHNGSNPRIAPLDKKPGSRPGVVRLSSGNIVKPACREDQRKAQGKPCSI
jgi:hypothetical protein